VARGRHYESTVEPGKLDCFSHYKAGGGAASICVPCLSCERLSFGLFSMYRAHWHYMPPPLPPPPVLPSPPAAPPSALAHLWEDLHLPPSILERVDVMFPTWLKANFAIAAHKLQQAFDALQHAIHHPQEEAWVIILAGGAMLLLCCVLPIAVRLPLCCAYRARRVKVRPSRRARRDRDRGSAYASMSRPRSSKQRTRSVNSSDSDGDDDEDLYEHPHASGCCSRCIFYLGCSLLLVVVVSMIVSMIYSVAVAVAEKDDDTVVEHQEHE